MKKINKILISSTIFTTISASLISSALFISSCSSNDSSTSVSPAPQPPIPPTNNGGTNNGGNNNGTTTKPQPSVEPNPNRPTNPTPQPPTPPENKPDNEPIDQRFVIEKSKIQYDKQFYINEIKNAYNKFNKLNSDFENNKKELAKTWSILIHNLVNLFYIVENQSIVNNFDFSSLQLTVEKLNYLTIIIQTSFTDWWFNFNMIENITYKFNEQNILTGLTFDSGNVKFNSLIYKKQLSKFIFDGLSLISDNMNELDKLAILSLYVCDFLNYSSNEETNVTLVDVLNTRVGVCRHYVILLMILLNAVGIENYAEYGNSFDNQVVGYHVWNMVKINNHWLAVDLTSSDLNANRFNLNPLNHSGPSMYFNKFFLMSKNNQNSFQTFNSTFKKLPLVNNVSNADKNINAYINQNATFLYNDYWSTNDINCILKSNDYRSYGQFTYYNDYWYAVKKQNNKTFKILKFDTKTPQANPEQIFLTNGGDVYLNLTINYKNLMIMVVKTQNNVFLCSYDLDDKTNNSLKKINSSYNIDVTTPMYIEDGILKQNNHEIVDLKTISNQQVINNNKIKPNMFNKIANVLKYATLIGDNTAQIPKNKISLLNTNVDNLPALTNFVNQIIDFNFLKDFDIKNLWISSPNTIYLNKDYFINNLQDKIGYLKIVNLLSMPSLWFNEVENNLIKYEWSFNQNIQPKQTNAYYNFNKIDNSNFNEILGEYKCTITNLWIDNNSKNKITKKFEIAETNTNQFENELFPYWININSSHNIINNEALNICINDLINFYQPNNNFEIKVTKNNKVINQKIIEANINTYEYRIETNNLKNNNYGIYNVQYLVNNNCIFSYNYYLFKFI